MIYVNCTEKAMNINIKKFIYSCTQLPSLPPKDELLAFQEILTVWDPIHISSTIHSQHTWYRFPAEAPLGDQHVISSQVLEQIWVLLVPFQIIPRYQIFDSLLNYLKIRLQAKRVVNRTSIKCCKKNKDPRKKERIWT